MLIIRGECVLVENNAAAIRVQKVVLLTLFEETAAEKDDFMTVSILRLIIPPYLNESNLRNDCGSNYFINIA